MERIHVSVRARPLSSDDAKTSPWRISGNSIFIPNLPSKFDFDQIFGEDCKTQDVYRARTRDIVGAAVRGFNGTVFAYGQTSSGKTHTMRGSNSEPGVIPLSVHDLFGIIHQETDREFLLRMSYMEIYNEEINDLLAPENRKLQIHESIERGIFVAGLREEIVVSPDQVLELMEFGESHRHIGETNMNVYSSRSHTIFRMIIESREKTNDAEAETACDAVRVSVLNLVDLAGSERAAKTGAEGVRLKEGSHINKSLMTLGTVIKKLSEGAESQGGHVPYRDSKLTRILQPALGGNSNTAIICNITLAQIHADETKSSLQFASRALRVTNCAHVNEILTDAALLKRQKKEIEELRAKLQGLHSEHLEEEILNLRNTLLKSELERERIALELEEEKRAQAEREKQLQEQARKIENLSTMVLCANRDETGDFYKKAKRRGTWCPGNLAREKVKELSSAIKEETTDVESTKSDRTVGPLLPFQELVKEASPTEFGQQEKDCQNSAPEDCSLPDPSALLNVTSRRKVVPRKRSLSMDSNDLAELQAQWEEMFLKLETHRIMSDIQIDYLVRKLAEADLIIDEKCNELTATNNDSISHSDGNRSLSDSDAILVNTQLQKQHYDEFLLSGEDSTLTYPALASAPSSSVVSGLTSVYAEESDWLTNLLTEARKMQQELENSKDLSGSISLAVGEHLHFLSGMPNLLFDLRASASENSLQMKSILRCHEKVESCLRSKVCELEDEKLALSNQASELQSKLEELNFEVQNSANAFVELNREHEIKESEFICQIQMLEREISSLSSCSLAKEKDNIRKDLERTKLKLKDTECKLKNAIQEKTKLEGEKSVAEREVKRLQGRNVKLERDMSKRESIMGRRRDSTIDRGSNVFDQKRNKGNVAFTELALQEEYKKLEVLAFEMEATIASLEDQLAAANEEKDAAISRAESLASDLQTLSDELNMSQSELSILKEEISILQTDFEASELHQQKLESCLNTLSEEKEELSMQLTEALLTMEEEKAIWSSKERASVKVIEEKEKLLTSETAMLSEKLAEARNELDVSRKTCKALEEWSTKLEENGTLEMHCSCIKKSSEVELSTKEQRSGFQKEIQQKDGNHFQILNPELDSERPNTLEEIENLKLELSLLRKEKDDLLSQVEKLNFKCPAVIDESQMVNLSSQLEERCDRITILEAKMHNDKVNNGKEIAKLRMRLRGAQAKLDNFRVRYQESVDELDYMNRRYEEASAKLKKQLASYGSEVLHLKKQLATLKGH